jgi:hypothetical protein
MPVRFVLPIEGLEPGLQLLGNFLNQHPPALSTIAPGRELAL